MRGDKARAASTKNGFAQICSCWQICLKDVETEEQTDGTKMVNATCVYQKHGFVNIKANVAIIMFTLVILLRANLCKSIFSTSNACVASGKRVR